MWTWIIENYVTIITIAAVLLLIAGAILILVRDKKKGKSSCGCNCKGCPMSASCKGGKQ